MLFTPNQIDELMLVVDRYQLLFIGENVGWELLSDNDKEILRQSGIDIEQMMSKEAIGYTEQAFKFGLLSEALGHKKAQAMDYPKFKRFVESGNFVPLTTREKGALASVKRQMYSDIRGLGNRMKQDLSSTMIEVDKKQRAVYEKIIQKEAQRSIENRTSVKDMVSRLGHKTNDWSRDFGRISDFIMHTAYDEGRAASIEKQYGSDSLVYKDVFDKACKYCIKLYTTAGIGTLPKVFKLSELITNGNNIGRKVAEWKPVIGSTHPFCRCTLANVPQGYDWNEKTRSFDIPQPFKRKVERKSKIRIVVDGETSLV